MREVQYLKNSQGNLTSVLINLEEYQAFWQEVLTEIDQTINFQFLVNENDEKIAVLLELPRDEELWEDIYDSFLVDELKDEDVISWEEFKQELEQENLVNV